MEFQREKAKELTKFFKQQQFNALINDSRCAHAHNTSLASFVTAREKRHFPSHTPLAHAPALSAPLPARSVFGWTKSNEISNGRWVMFGLFVGMVTEYATGVDFPNQLKLTVSVLGIAVRDAWRSGAGSAQCVCVWLGALTLLVCAAGRVRLSYTRRCRRNAPA
jgi:hypothetical protein